MPNGIQSTIKVIDETKPSTPQLVNERLKAQGYSKKETAAFNKACKTTTKKEEKMNKIPCKCRDLIICEPCYLRNMRKQFNIK